MTFRTRGALSAVTQRTQSRTWVWHCNHHEVQQAREGVPGELINYAKQTLVSEEYKRMADRLWLKSIASNFPRPAEGQLAYLMVREVWVSGEWQETGE